jgi:hypothetical protein
MPLVCNVKLSGVIQPGTSANSPERSRRSARGSTLPSYVNRHGRMAVNTLLIDPIWKIRSS